MQPLMHRSHRQCQLGALFDVKSIDDGASTLGAPACLNLRAGTPVQYAILAEDLSFCFCSPFERRAVHTAKFSRLASLMCILSLETRLQLLKTQLPGWRVPPDGHL